MLYRKIVSLTSSIALICVAGLCCRGESAERQKLAVVNVSAVFEQYNKVADVQTRIDKMHEARKKELDQRGKDLADLNRRLNEMYKAAGQSEQVFDEVQKLRKFQFLYERDVAKLNAQIQTDYTREMREVLSDIRQAIKSYAESAGFDMVLRSPDSDNPDSAKVEPGKLKDPAVVEKQTYLQKQEAQTLAEVIERFHRNPVLYRSETADITSEVLLRLNAAFMKRSLTGAAPK